MIPLQDLIGHTKPHLAGILEAIVIDNNDPLELCRVKIEIPGLLGSSGVVLNESIVEGKVVVSGYSESDSLSPWVSPLAPYFLGGSSSAGQVSIPLVGSTVSVIFKNGNPYEGRYFASNLSQGKIPSELLEDYPNSYGFKDDVGFLVKINKTKKELTVLHPTGTKIFVSSDGSVLVDSQNDITIQAKNNIVMKAVNITLDATTNVLIKAGKAITKIAPKIYGRG